MRLPRIYTQQSLDTDTTIKLETTASHHISHVLRLKVSAPLQVFNGNGSEYNATIMLIDNNSVHVLLGEQQQPIRESLLQIELAQGISRGDRMDYALQKSAELGVNQITPLWTRRTEVKLEGKRLQKRLEHWKGIVRSACEQSGRLMVPTLNDATFLDTWCKNNADYDLQLLLDPSAEQALKGLQPGNGRIRILIGPEGGLDEDEIVLAQTYGFTAIRLGPRILRTETAAVAALSAVQTLWGDIGIA